MQRDLDLALRYRNYAEELRIMAADGATPDTRKSLLDIAQFYDHAAGTFEAMDRSRRASGLKSNSG